MTGLKIKRVLAKMDIVVPGRVLDDNDVVLVEFEGGATGVFWTSQFAIGHDNDLRVRIYGEDGSIQWKQEECEKVTMIARDGTVTERHRGNGGIEPEAAKYGRLPSGHTEGWLESMGLIIITGDIDLSVGAILGCVASFGCLIFNLTDSILLTLLFCLAFGTLLGFFNGAMSNNKTKERTFFQHAGGNAYYGEEHIDWDKLDVDIFHIGYILLLPHLDEPDAEYGTKMARLLCRAQKQGLKTSIDVVSEAGERFQRIVTPSLRYCDYCIINELEAQQTTGVLLRGEDGVLHTENLRKALEKLHELGVSTWAVIHCPELGCGMAVSTSSFSSGIDSSRSRMASP